jgi:hypothetical protein
MTEKLNLHTDPSGILESLKAATDGRVYLGDIREVERIVRGFASEVITRFDEVGHGVLTPGDAADADRAQCLKLASVFTGADPAYAPVRNWTGKPLADHLRNRMERELVPDDDDVQLVAQAFAVFVHSVYDLLREASAGAPGEETEQTLVAAVRSISMALTGVVGND